MNNKEESQNGVFLNGRAQVYEMMPLLSKEEQRKLIKNIRIRNPKLADELQENSLSFKDILNFDDHTVQILLRYVKAPILGIALKSLPVDGQRKILCLCERDYAEEAYKTMSAHLSREMQDTAKATQRIKSIMGALVKKGYITIA